jgi:O-antigen ligase
MSSWTSKIIRRAPLMVELGFLLWMLVSSSTVSPFFFSASLFLVFAGAALDLAGRIDLSRSTRIFGKIGAAAVGLTLLNFFLHPITHATASRCLELLAFVVGVAVLRADEGPSRTGRLSRFLSLAILLVLFGLAQRLYLFELLRLDALKIRPDILDGERGLFFKSPRARSTFGQANAFAGFLILVVPFAVIAVAAKGRRRFAGAVLLALLFAGLLASGSKGGTAVALVVGAFALRSAPGDSGRFRRAAFRLLLASAAAMSAVVAADLMGADLPRPLSDVAATLELRFDYWRAAWALFREHPFRGVGLGEFGDFATGYFGKSSSGSRRAHSFIFTALAEGGVVGLGLLATFAAALFRLRRRPDDAVPADKSHGPAPSMWRDYRPLAALLVIAPYLAGPSDIDLYFWPFANARVFDIAGAAIALSITACADRFIARPIAEFFRDDRTAGMSAIAIGLAGISAHALIDFDFEIVGCLGAAAVVAALWPIASGPERKCGRFEALVAGATAVVLFSVGLSWSLRMLYAHEFRAFFFEERMIRGTLLSAARSPEVLADWESEARRFAPDLEIAASLVDRAVLSADRDAIARAEAVLADLDPRLLRRAPLDRRKAALDFIANRSSDDPRVWRSTIEAAVTRFEIGR